MMVAPILLTVLRLGLAAVFVVSAWAKIADRAGFRSSLAGFGVPGGLRPVLASLIPVVELLIAGGLLPAGSAWFAAVTALGLLAVFTVVITVSLARGRRPECHCFGKLSSAPVGWGSVVRNVALIAAAAVVTGAGPAHAGPSMVAWAGRLSLPAVVGLAAGAVVLALVAGQTWMFIHVLGQNGRLLLRLDAVEAALAGAGLQVGPAAGPPPAGPDRRLSVGASAPAFALKRLGGGTSAMTELLSVGKPLALAFVDPHCGPCTALLPELARWERELADQLTLAVVTAGTAEANKPKFAGHGLQHVLLQNDREVSGAYQAYGTPAMVFVGADGTISSPVAAGRDAIRALMASVAGAQPRPAAANGQKEPNAVAGDGSGAHADSVAHQQSRIGEAAPILSLPDLDGRQASLPVVPGRQTLVLFWNPACHFCQEMLNDLKTWQATRSEASPALVVVSTGSAEANRAMGLRAPVLLDARFETGRAFGAAGTPSAVLVDQHGRVASGVAVGAAAVMALAAGHVTAVKAGV